MECDGTMFAHQGTEDLLPSSGLFRVLAPDPHQGVDAILSRGNVAPGMHKAIMTELIDLMGESGDSTLVLTQLHL